jgi:histidinol phosphatase-like PHP family hydrolase
MKRATVSYENLSSRLEHLNSISELAESAVRDLQRAEQEEVWVPTEYETTYLPGLKLSGLANSANVCLQSSADLHIHSCASDGSPIVDIIEMALMKRLDVIAITDHDTIEGALQARRYVHENRIPLAIIPGIEVSSADGHIGALFVNRNIPKGLSAEKTIALIHEAGGLAVAHHPVVPHFLQFISESRLAIGEEFLDLPFDAVEITNAVPGYGARYNIMTQNLVKDNGCIMAFTGGSDAHHYSQVGKGLTFFGGNRGVESLRRSLEEGVTLAAEGYWSTWEKIAYYARFFGRYLGFK